MVGIINYGAGNLFSVQHALDAVGAATKICSTPAELESAERIVLPGVGSFGSCMESLEKLGFPRALNHLVLELKRPIIGLCVGMQMMATRGFEHGERLGLGWFEGEVRRLEPDDKSLRIPHMGWNEIHLTSKSPLFAGLTANPEVYFVHSYTMTLKHAGEMDAWADYGGKVTAAIRRGNIFATQFHPEKSQQVGLKILENFLNWKPS